jgi:hypothetical protein
MIGGLSRHKGRSEAFSPLEGRAVGHGFIIVPIALNPAVVAEP